ncbi:MAG TPA: hypothetical protein VER04_03495, partial [Polyangiaceae bacterium]|nr:hypothetical protein [Polyangiaceae bacterium]
MIFLAASCERCPDTSLISSDDCIAADATCRACGAQLELIGGRMFLEGDVPLFEELSALICHSAIVGTEAERLATMMEESALRDGEQEALGVLTSAVPQLAPLRPL